MAERPPITAEALHEAADRVGAMGEPPWFAELKRFVDESHFPLEEGGPPLPLDRVTLAYGVSVGIEAARALEEEPHG